MQGHFSFLEKKIKNKPFLRQMQNIAEEGLLKLWFEFWRMSITDLK